MILALTFFWLLITLALFMLPYIYQEKEELDYKTSLLISLRKDKDEVCFLAKTKVINLYMYVDPNFDLDSDIEFNIPSLLQSTVKTNKKGKVDLSYMLSSSMYSNFACVTKTEGPPFVLEFVME